MYAIFVTLAVFNDEFVVLFRNVIIVSVPFVQQKVLFVQNIKKYREELPENTPKVFNRIK